MSMSAIKNSYDLEDRLINFACLCIEIGDLMPNSCAGKVLEQQLVKSATACALNYGEAQAAESKADFLHKIRITLKEIRETRVNLRIINQRPLVVHEKLDKALSEVNQLMAIFIKTVTTIKNNAKNNINQ
jgi:four helix bundle protein